MILVSLPLTAGIGVSDGKRIPAASACLPLLITLHFTSPRIITFSQIFPIQLISDLLLMLFPPAGIAPMLLLAAAALLRYVPPADGPAVDLPVLLPGFVLLARLFCPHSSADRNRYVVRLCSSSPFLLVISPGPVLLKTGASS